MAPCNKQYPFLYHSLLSIDWLYCLWVKGPKFAWVTILAPQMGWQSRVGTSPMAHWLLASGSSWIQSSSNLSTFVSGTVPSVRHRPGAAGPRHCDEGSKRKAIFTGDSLSWEGPIGLSYNYYSLNKIYLLIWVGRRFSFWEGKLISVL